MEARLRAVAGAVARLGVDRTLIPMCSYSRPHAIIHASKFQWVELWDRLFQAGIWVTFESPPPPLGQYYSMRRVLVTRHIARNNLRTCFLLVR